MNVADSQEMVRALGPYGFAATAHEEKADAIIINTCTVRQHAEDKAFSYIGRLKTWKENEPQRILIVAGCAAERTKEFLQQRFPYIDLVVGAKSIDAFPAIIKEVLKEKFSWARDNENVWTETGKPIAPAPNSVSAYVSVMRGCNYSCSYCIVPSVRGREIYRPLPAILDELRQAVAQGAKEIMLLGQTVNSYHDKDCDFSGLLEHAAAVDGVKRLRFMSPHPHYFTDKLIATMARLPAICEHLHLPAQSGSNRILKLMQRNYTKEQYLDIVRRLKSAIPDLAITTDIIVGFPSETEDDFKESLQLVEEARFNGAFCFKFSPRQGTPAENMAPQLPREIKEERLRQLLNATKRLAAEHAAAQVGKTLEVLFESPEEGRSRNFYKVEVSAAENFSGRLQSVVITEAKNKKLYGKLQGWDKGIIKIA